MRQAVAGLLVGSTIALFAARTAAATTINIDNSDFSMPMLSDGGYTAYGGSPNTIPDWTNPNIAGVQNNFGTYASMPGNAANFAYDDGGTIAQQLTSNLQVGDYTFDVYAGWRASKADFGGGSIDVSAGAYDQSATLTTPSQGAFLLETLTFTTLPTNPDLGQPLVVSLVSNGNSVDFGIVSLNFTPVPEPATFVTLALGAAAVFVVGRRRRRFA